MEILMIIIGVLAVVSMIAFLVHLFIKAINKDQQEQDERILQLEKRLEKYRKDRDDELVNIYDNISINNDDIKDLINRIQKLERKKKSDKNEL